MGDEPNRPRPGSRSPVIDTILRRRSHRVGFDDIEVPIELLEQIVDCGLAAPSSKNAQPWRFHVVTDDVLIREMADIVRMSPSGGEYVPRDPDTGDPREGWESTVVESAEILAGARAAIFVENLGRFSGGRRRLTKLDRPDLSGALVAYALECAGLGGAIENLWLAAEALGLKAAFLGDVGVEADLLEQRLGMDGEVLGVLAIGYSQRPPEIKRGVGDDRPRVRWHDADRRPPRAP